MQSSFDGSGIDSEMKLQDNQDEKNSIDLERYRNLVRTFIDLRRYKTALFWAEKAVALGDYQPKDIYWWTHCMVLLREYHRAAHIIKLHGLEKTNIFCHHLLIECLYEAKEFTEAIDLMNTIDLDYLSSSVINSADGTSANDTALQILATVDIDDIGPSKSEVLSAIYFLKGKILEAMDNRNMAMNCYIEALHLDVYCTEALDALVQHEMLLASEEQELITHLPFDSQCTENERKIIEKLYKSKLKKYHESTIAHMANNPNQTPTQNFDNVATIKAILEQSEKTKTERTNTELKLSNKDASKFLAPTQQDIRTPSPPKFGQDVKSSSLYTRLNKHESMSQGSIMNITPLHSNRSVSTQPKSKRKVYKHANLPKSLSSVPVQTCFDRLKNSLDIITERAAHLFYNGEYKQCINVLNEVLKNDPYHCPALIILIGCLIELKDHSKLFCIAHKLVDLYSDQAISWYAVGCYYDLIGKSDPARRYLSKATSIDRLFGPAWLGFGHSFAKENEHDQAMAAYFKATQLMRGCHLPLLYIGVECGLTKNFDLSQKFFYQAMSIAPLDVFVLHELGVIKFEYDHFQEAEEILRITLEMVTQLAGKNDEPISIRWEPLINNLGHCCRKNKKYDQALKYHRQALALRPQNPATYTAIGFVYALKNNLEKAVEYLHRSLALKRDDIVTTALLKSCLEDLMNEDSLPRSLSDSQDDQDIDGFNSIQKHDIKSKMPSTFAMKPPCMKINFDADSNQSQGSELIDLDMSME